MLRQGGLQFVDKRYFHRLREFCLSRARLHARTRTEPRRIAAAPALPRGESPSAVCGRNPTAADFTFFQCGRRSECARQNDGLRRPEIAGTPETRSRCSRRWDSYGP